MSTDVLQPGAVHYRRLSDHKLSEAGTQYALPYGDNLRSFVWVFCTLKVKRISVGNLECFSLSWAKFQAFLFHEVLKLQCAVAGVLRSSDRQNPLAIFAPLGIAVRQRTGNQIRFIVVISVDGHALPTSENR
jgi:hypothetical protein